MKTNKYVKELRKLQAALCKLQDWVKHKGLRVMKGRQFVPEKY